MAPQCCGIIYHPPQATVLMPIRSLRDTALHPTRHYLELLADDSYDSIDWDEKDHHCHTSKHRRAHGLVEEYD